MTTKDRDLVELIDKLIEWAPELGPGKLEPIRSSAVFTAPEIMHLRWAEVQEILQRNITPEHPHFKRITALWNNEPVHPPAWYDGYNSAMADVAHALGRDDVTLEELESIRALLEGQTRPIREVYKATVIRALEKNDGNISKTARELGVDRRTLYRRLERWGLARRKEAT